jgi:hypothetical protein
MENPFFYGNPVPPASFIGRRREIRRVAGRLCNGGQSSAIIGEPRSGKTSLLDYLSAPEFRSELYGAAGERFLFQFIDSQTLGVQFTQAQFWEYALQPFFERVVAPDPAGPLGQAYEFCQQNSFGTFSLERLFTKMTLEPWRLVLMLDEFDQLLHHPILNCGEFFGSLRSLTSRNRALALIIAARSSLGELNEATQEMSHHGSPYFNFLDELMLSPLTDRDVAELLDRASERFSPDDCQFVLQVAGGHPYLLQAAGYELWETYEEGEPDALRRRAEAGRRLYDKAAMVISDTWRIWEPATKRAFATIALMQLNLPHLEGIELDDSLQDLGPERTFLEKQGYVMMAESMPGGWMVRPQAYLWWMADELLRAVREEAVFEAWLRALEWETFFRQGDREPLARAARLIGDGLKGGAYILIQGEKKK